MKLARFDDNLINDEIDLTGEFPRLVRRGSVLVEEVGTSNKIKHFHSCSNE